MAIIKSPEIITERFQYTTGLKNSRFKIYAVPWYSARKISFVVFKICLKVWFHNQTAQLCFSFTYHFVTIHMHLFLSQSGYLPNEYKNTNRSEADWKWKRKEPSFSLYSVALVRRLYARCNSFSPLNKIWLKKLLDSVKWDFTFDHHGGRDRTLKYGPYINRWFIEAGQRTRPCIINFSGVVSHWDIYIYVFSIFSVVIFTDSLHHRLN